MNDIVVKAAICVGGFLGMFLPLYLFADPGISPLYGSAQISVASIAPAQKPRDSMQESNNDAEFTRDVAYTEDEPDYNYGYEYEEPIVIPDTEESENEYAVNRDKILSLWIQGVKDILQNQWGDNWTLDQQENLISATMWYDGVVADALLSAIVQGGVPAEWDEMCSSYEKNAQAAYKSMVDVGLDDMHLMYGLANDRNPENSILVTCDGYIVYDVFDELRDSDLADAKTKNEQDFFNTLTERQRLTLYLATLQTALQIALDGADIEGEYLLDADEQIIALNTKGDGMAEDALLAYEQNGNRIPEEWVYMRGEYESACQKMYDTLKDYGLSNWNIVLNLLNDTNTDKALLKIMNGTTIYDCLEELP